MPITTLIHSGRIIDGTGNPYFYGDIALENGKISTIEPPGAIPRDGIDEIVDASGHIVCPGFIDIQSHSIVPLMRDGQMPLQNHTGHHDRNHGRSVDPRTCRWLQ